LMATKLEGEELSSKRLVKYKQSFTLTVIEYRYYSSCLANLVWR
jgi:hypothetical protein